MPASEDENVLLGEMTGLGVSSPDVDGELAFLKLFGASDPLLTKRERWHVYLGSNRTHFVLFRRATYADRMDELALEPRPGGINHVAFRVSSTERILERAAQARIEPMYGPFRVEPGPTGPARLITYFRSRGGLILETQETTER